MHVFNRRDTHTNAIDPINEFLCADESDQLMLEMQYQTNDRALPVVNAAEKWTVRCGQALKVNDAIVASVCMVSPGTDMDHGLRRMINGSSEDIQSALL